MIIVIIIPLLGDLAFKVLRPVYSRQLLTIFWVVISLAPTKVMIANLAIMISQIERMKEL